MSRRGAARLLSPGTWLDHTPALLVGWALVAVGQWLATVAALGTAANAALSALVLTPASAWILGTALTAQSRKGDPDDAATLPDGAAGRAQLVDHLLVALVLALVLVPGTLVTAATAQAVIAAPAHHLAPAQRQAALLVALFAAFVVVAAALVCAARRHRHESVAGRDLALVFAVATSAWCVGWGLTSLGAAATLLVTGALLADVAPSVALLPAAVFALSAAWVLLHELVAWRVTAAAESGPAQAPPSPTAQLVRSGGAALIGPDVFELLGAVEHLAVAEGDSLNEARAHGEALLAQHPLNAGLHGALAKVYRRAGDLEQALRTASEAVRLGLSSGAAPVAVDVLISFWGERDGLRLGTEVLEHLERVLRQQGRASEADWCASRRG